MHTVWKKQEFTFTWKKILEINVIYEWFWFLGICNLHYEQFYVKSFWMLSFRDYMYLCQKLQIFTSIQTLHTWNNFLHIQCLQKYQLTVLLKNYVKSTLYSIHYYIIYYSQCGNYGNSLSYIFGKNFVNVAVLLNKLLKSWFDEIFLGKREFFVFPHCTVTCGLSGNYGILLPQIFFHKFRQINVYY